MSKIVSTALIVVFVLSSLAVLAYAKPMANDSQQTDDQLSAAVNIFTETFEGYFPASPWRVGDDNGLDGLDYWDDTNYRAKYGYWSGWCAQIGTQAETGQPNYYVHQYDDYMLAWMQRPISLTGYTSATFSYWYFIDCEANFDYLEVIIYERHDYQWHYVDRHTGSSYGWLYSSVNVPLDTMYIGFRFSSDYSIHNREGAYVDQLVCTAYTAPALYFANGFEAGSFSGWTGVTKTYGETAAVTTTRKYSGSYGARFTSNGGGHTTGEVNEKSTCYKSIVSSTELYARAYFYVSQSGIVHNNDRFHLITFSVGTNNVAYASWRKTSTGYLRWSLMIRHGTGPNWPTVYSGVTPVKYRWYCVELHWRMGTTTGMGELFVNGARVCIITGKNTASFGAVNRVYFGLAGLVHCGSTTVYCDNARIQTTYIGTPLP